MESVKEEEKHSVCKEEKHGVCYLSRIPPHMKPMKLRQLLSQHAEVLRVYLVPEDHDVRNKRKKAGGNKGKNFTEGWVEFGKRKDAKYVAEILNGQPMGGKRRSAYFYDIWNIKYLKKFQWSQLSEEIAYRKSVHDQKLAVEISTAKRERDFYLARVDQAKKQAAIEEKKRKRRELQNGGEGASEEQPKQKMMRTFVQKNTLAGKDSKPGLAKEVLARVFARRTEEPETA